MNFRGCACVNPKYIFFCILEHLDGIYVEMSVQALEIFLFNRSTEQSVNYHLREFNIPKKKH